MLSERQPHCDPSAHFKEIAMLTRRNFMTTAGAATCLVSPVALVAAAGPGRVLRRWDLADLCCERGDDLEPAPVPGPAPEGQGSRLLALRVLALAGQGHRRHPQAQPGARADGDPVLGLAGQGLWPWDH